MLLKNVKDGGEINITVAIPQTIEVDRIHQAIQEIKIFHQAGTWAGGTTTAYAANSILQKFSLKLGNVKLYDEIDADHWREVMRLMYSIAPLAEQWVIPFHAPCHLRTANLQHPIMMSVQNETLAGIQGAGGDRTSYSGAKYHVLLDAINAPGRVKNDGYFSCWETQLVQHSLGSTAASVHKVDLLSGRIYKNLLLYIRDNAAADHLAIDGEQIQIKVGRNIVWECTVQTLLEEIQENHFIAPNTGYLLLEFDEPIDTRGALDVSLNVKLQSTASPSAANPAGTVDITLLANHMVPLS